MDLVGGWMDFWSNLVYGVGGGGSSSQTTDKGQKAGEPATTDPFKSTLFLLSCLVIWPDQVHAREISRIMKRRHKLGPPMCMFAL